VLDSYDSAVVLPAQVIPIAVVDRETGQLISSPPTLVWPSLTPAIAPPSNQQAWSDLDDIPDIQFATDRTKPRSARSSKGRRSGDDDGSGGVPTGSEAPRSQAEAVLVPPPPHLDGVGVMPGTGVKSAPGAMPGSTDSGKQV
jgi:hypothetical protein